MTNGKQPDCHHQASDPIRVLWSDKSEMCSIIMYDTVWQSAAGHVGPDIHPHAMPRSASHFSLFSFSPRASLETKGHTGLESGEWRGVATEPPSYLTYDLESNIHPCPAHSLGFERCAACRCRPRPNRLGGHGRKRGDRSHRC